MAAVAIPRQNTTLGPIKDFSTRIGSLYMVMPTLQTRYQPPPAQVLLGPRSQPLDGILNRGSEIWGQRALVPKISGAPLSA